MALTIVEDSRVITDGVDTHADMHVAAALDPIGGLPGVGEFPVTSAGYAHLLGWLGGFGTVGLVAICVGSWRSIMVLDLASWCSTWAAAWDPGGPEAG
jgi:hypothetical protein